MHLIRNLWRLPCAMEPTNKVHMERKMDRRPKSELFTNRIALEKVNDSYKRERKKKKKQNCADALTFKFGPMKDDLHEIFGFEIHLKMICSKKKYTLASMSLSAVAQVFQNFRGF